MQLLQLERDKRYPSRALPGSSSIVVLFKKKMSARGQATLEDVGLRQKRFSATTETDGYLDDFIQKLENEIGVITTTKVEVNDKQIRTFFRNAKVSFVGQTEDEEPPTKKRRRMSQKESVFKNETEVPVDFTFCKKAETVTTAQLKTRSGFKIGVLALAGGGVGLRSQRRIQ